MAGIKCIQLLNSSAQKEIAIGWNDQVTFFSIQLTWVSNEIEDFDLILFEFLDRLAEPKGWLCKLWECLTERGVAVFAASQKWDGKMIGQYIGKWYV